MNTDELLGGTSNSPEGLILTLLLLICVIIAKEIVKHVWEKKESVKQAATPPAVKITDNMMVTLELIWRQIDPSRNDNLASRIDKFISKSVKEDDQ